MRQGPRRPGFPDRGAEDRQEGPQGVSREGWKALNGKDVNMDGVGVLPGNMIWATAGNSSIRFSKMNGNGLACRLAERNGLARQNE